MTDSNTPDAANAMADRYRGRSVAKESYHRGRAAGLAWGEARIAELEAALERLLRNAEHIFNKQPVRDWDEALHEARAALTPPEDKP